MATILFVDDDEVERIFAREVLEPRGHKVLFAGDGESALEIYRRPGLDIDVVVTDLAMPRLNGLRLIKALREYDPEARIIAASGIAADQLDLAEEFGAVAALSKPWSPPRFVAALDDVLTRAEAARDWTRGHWEEIWPEKEKRGRGEVADDGSPPIADLIGRWEGDEHIFPAPWAPEGVMARGTIEIRSVMGDTALLLEHQREVQGTVRRRGLTLLIWDGYSGEVVHYGFVSGGTSPSVFRGAWDGRLLQVEGPGPGGQVRHERSWHDEIMTLRSWTLPEDSAAEILAFEGTYQRVRSADTRA
ncbi:response regulator [Gaopeijia maritima]|uniref:Response regulator n=1 Tax=Gaopeijia maritima TaxID=3119007 RepID=A0ABU9E9K6_9BACT